ncbi:MAG: FolB domain-containing protein [Alphaproteobacteria bacterium]|nr:FolB domain-containing protein [Alphaproteobacteria bacterium]
MAANDTARGKIVALAPVDAAIRKVLIGDLVLPTMIGVFKREKLRPQRVRFNIELGVVDRPPRQDRPSEIVCYDRIVKSVRALVAEGHVNLVETLAERVAELCLAAPSALYVRVRVEKLDIYPDAAAVGVEIERRNEVR